jgi:hypothetical protein
MTNKPIDPLKNQENLSKDLERKNQQLAVKLHLNGQQKVLLDVLEEQDQRLASMSPLPSTLDFYEILLYKNSFIVTGFQFSVVSYR